MQLEMEPLYDSTKNVHNRQLTKRAVYGHFVFRFIARMRFCLKLLRSFDRRSLIDGGVQERLGRAVVDRDYVAVARSARCGE